MPHFDAWAADYDAALDGGIRISGEDKAFFARGRIAWLARCLGTSRWMTRRVLDFGCGTGSAAPLFLEMLGTRLVTGVDVSMRSIGVAAKAFSSERVRFFCVSDYEPDGAEDLAFCNGVFHHIPPKERGEAVRYVYQSLRPGGLFALWENNPWNPGTRLVMKRIPFDRDAVMLSSLCGRRLLREAGFQVLRTDFLFIFPRPLRRLRWMEPPLSRLPLGAQYQILARVPG